MSITIRWRPATDNGRAFTSGTSHSFECLKEACGQVVEPHHVPMLRAMARAARDTFYDEVADIVERNGKIEIWGTY